MTDYDSSARLFKAFSDPNRLKILSTLQHGEKCATALIDELNIEQPTLSHHMKILTKAELVSCRKDGKWTYYELNAKGFSNAMMVIFNFSFKSF